MVSATLRSYRKLNTEETTNLDTEQCLNDNTEYITCVEIKDKLENLTNLMDTSTTNSDESVDAESLDDNVSYHDDQNEHQPLLQNYMKQSDVLYIDHNGVNGINGKNGKLEMILDNNYPLSESDDTDSYSTPTDSPCKMRLESSRLESLSLLGPPKLFSERKGRISIRNMKCYCRISIQF